MPNWVTDEKGLWHPAKEKVALTNHSDKPFKNPTTGEMVQPGDVFIYEGPDRAALFELYKIDKTGKTTTLGENFRQNTEFLEYYAKMRNAFGFESVDAFLSYLGYNEEEKKKEFESKASVINKHDLPKRVEMIKQVGGGSDTATGKNVRYGGFGEIPSN